MEQNSELALAWQFIENTGTHLFLTGKAGTGKTTFLRRLKQESPKRMVVLAPTGIAAINAGGVTIHSFFQIPFAPYVPESSFSTNATYRFRFGKEKINIIRSMDLLVIDEISMVRADLLDAVDEMLRRYRDHHKPFGGVQLLMIGDLQQLAPVVKEEEWQEVLSAAREMEKGLSADDGRERLAGEIGDGEEDAALYSDVGRHGKKKSRDDDDGFVDSAIRRKR